MSGQLCTLVMFRKMMGWGWFQSLFLFILGTGGRTNTVKVNNIKNCFTKMNSFQNSDLNIPLKATNVFKYICCLNDASSNEISIKNIENEENKLEHTAPLDHTPETVSSVSKILRESGCNVVLWQRKTKMGKNGRKANGGKQKWAKSKQTTDR